MWENSGLQRLDPRDADDVYCHVKQYSDGILHQRFYGVHRVLFGV